MSNTKKDSRLMEVIRFVVTGGVSFVVEFVCLTALCDGLHMDTLIATPIAFLVSVIVNYLLCMAWVFKGTKDGGNAARIGFIATSAIGLLLNEVLMLLFRVLWGEEAVLFSLFGFDLKLYMINKVIATLIVMVWNYFTKRAVLQSDIIARLSRKK